MVAAVAVTDGDKLQPPIGASVFGRMLSSKILQKIEETTKLELALFPINKISDPNLKQYFTIISNNDSGHTAHPLDETTLEGFTVIRDINSKPIGMFKMTTPRSIYMTGVEAINYYLISFIALGVIFSLLMLWLLRILIINA